MDDINIELAKKEDIVDILEIIYKRCLWLKKNNLEQWHIERYPKKYNMDYFLNVMNTDKLFVAKKDNKTVGIVLLKLKDTDYWKYDDNQAYYMHHLATNSELKGLGEKIINFCIEYAKSNNKKYLRLDCKDSNEKLNSYYERLGFILKGNGSKQYHSYNLRELKIK